MANTTEGTYLNDFLRWEQDNHYSRDKVTIAASQTITKGEVLGKITASGYYAVFNQDASDGTETAAGIALGDYTTGEGETLSGVALVRDAIVVEEYLTFPSDITSGEQATAMASLKTLGIITKTEA